MWLRGNWSAGFLFLEKFDFFFFFLFFDFVGGLSWLKIGVFIWVLEIFF